MVGATPQYVKIKITPNPCIYNGSYSYMCHAHAAIMLLYHIATSQHIHVHICLINYINVTGFVKRVLM